MYQYDEFDRQIVRDRVAQFRDQTRRYFAGQLTDEEFRPLRLQNGLYIQRHAPMLRIAVPYGLLSSKQLRRLAHVSRKYDRGYGHFTTRQNLQLNWPELARVPDILAELAEVEMHAIQTSGNCIRNITTDPYAGIAPDEMLDPRPLCEILRQWSTFHPEFAYLPRKFKIAVNGAEADRAVTYLHDIGLHLVKNDVGELGFRVLVGGGMGRTPVIGKVIREFLPWQHVLTYCEAILRVYNRFGRRDNPFKARIKILVNAMGKEEFARQVEEEWVHLKDGPSTITQEEYDRVAAHFVAPAYRTLPASNAGFEALQRDNIPFAKWVERNVRAHRIPGHAAVTVSLKKPGVAPGDCTSDQMDLVADLADKYSFGELRVTHEQNLVLSDVEQSRLFELWQTLRDNGLATPTIGLITDIICCPGGDFCDLANAKSIPIAAAIQQRFDDLDYQHDIGDIEINISGCMNSCGHHHVGHIGILGVDKHDEEWYQISIGGQQGLSASLAKVIGPSFAAADVPDVIQKLIDLYLQQRHEDELFIDVVERLGVEPFQKAVYGERTRGVVAPKGRWPMAEIIKGRTVVADDWGVLRLAEGQTAVDIKLPEGKVIVPLAVWQARRGELAVRATTGTLGIWLSDTEGPEAIADDLDKFQVVALDFPKFSNGRSYSSAALLRTRYGYRGELRAIGDVLCDQMFYLARVGFDAFAVRSDRSIQDALNALNDFSVTYQGSTDQPQPLFRRVQRAAA